MSEETAFYTVPAQFQIVVEPLKTPESIEQKELLLSRPSPFSSLRLSLENQIRAGDQSMGNKELVTKAFELLLSVEQRLNRVEEFLSHKERGKSVPLYQWVQGSIGAGALNFTLPEGQNADAQVLWVDLLLPSVPEYRVQLLANVTDRSGTMLNCSFRKIHDEDREQIFRFVRQREREIIRAKSKGE